MKKNDLMYGVSESEFRRIRQQTNLDLERPIEGLNLSCTGCKENFCCINQKDISVLDFEFDNIKYHIEDKHIERAKKELNRQDNLISCPFNDPETKQCDIYKDRFIMCALHKVVSPIEDCDSILKPNATTLIVSKNEQAFRLKHNSLVYVKVLGKSTKESNVIKQFKRVYKI
jgi:Fe-S-cluster containining protein